MIRAYPLTCSTRYCPTCDTETEWSNTNRRKSERCQGCAKRRKSEAGVRAAATKKRKAAKRANLGYGLVTYSKLLRQCDDLWSVVCRAEATECAMCHVELPPEALQWAHHRPRNKPKWMRYRTENYSALCAPCHRRHSPNGPEWFDWLRDVRLGPDVYLWLNQMAQTRGKLGLQELGRWLMLAQQRLHALPAGDRRDWAFTRAEKIRGRACA